ncbi:hypothetical protein FACS1894204_00390 [Synergistales bacterium]|nr:hypothetical protein FACS1894204_00390 [Synergistales bacterium]
MKNCKKTFTLFLAMALTLALTVCGGTPAGASTADEFAKTKYNLSVGTTSVGGIYNLVATAWSQTIQKHLSNVNWDVQVTGGSVGNMQLYANGELDLPMALAVTMVEAKAGGNRSFPNALAFDSICVINQGFFHIVASTKSGIKTIEDLKGKRISTAEPGHSTESVAMTLFDIMGWDIETDISRQRLNLQDSVDALSDGRIDAMFYMGGAPVTAVQEACLTAGTGYMISVDPAIIEKISKKYSYIVLGAAPVGMFKNEQPVTSLACNNFLCCSPDMDEELVYNMTKAIFDNCAEWQGSHSSVANLVADNACSGSPTDFHPGAIRYFKEVGAWKE